jgi:hypothetical protein
MKLATGSRVGVLLGVGALLLTGCRGDTGPTSAATGPARGGGQPTNQVAGKPPAPPAPNPPAGGGGGGGGGGPGNAAGMDVRRTIDRSAVSNDLKEIARFYTLYNTENNRSPASQKDLEEYVKREAPKLYKSLQDGVFVVVPNAALSSNTVIAYEKDADRAGNQFVAMGDGSVQKMTAQQLQAALKGK